ncbi:TRAP transporter substrate-binding protein [Marinivivus vitaminiproducens]|uniref:TRAP transporter substrate-binding protein n=1 Tax=Marinivivus vitaminiproducens TaxID=3035935 RepID=UPI0027A60DC3|nr:TRAP transporter substrate-binding protein [Geminicoccaceae bacterium SCSIO 64248]
MKTILQTVLAVVGLALGSGSAAAQTEWLMASGYPESNYFTQNIRTFIEEVGANSDLQIELAPNDTLIKLDAIKTAVQRGQVQMGEIRLGVYSNEDPMYELEALPFVAPTYADAWLLKDLQREYFDTLMTEAGLRVLFYAPWPGQGFYTRDEVTAVSGFSGKKLRIFSAPTQRMGEMMGFEATILPFAEVPQAFSTGLIDSLFTSPQTGIDIQAWDNTKYFMKVGAMYSKNAVIVSESYWEELSPETQEVVLAAAKRAELRGWEMSAKADAEQTGVLAQNGMTVTEASEEVVGRMTEVGDALLEDWRGKASPEAIAVLDRYLALR